MEWVFFNVTKKRERALLVWKVTDPQSIRSFYIQRINEGNWETIDSINANDQTYAYDATDNSPLMGENQYRIAVRKHNNGFTYSPVRHLRYEEISQQLAIYPNPATNKIIVSGEFSAGSVLRIIDLSGRQILRKKIKSSNRVELLLPEISRGIYFLQLNNRRGKLIVR
jgi:hypothetical protein